MFTKNYSDSDTRTTQSSFTSSASAASSAFSSATSGNPPDFSEIIQAEIPDVTNEQPMSEGKSDKQKDMDSMDNTDNEADRKDAGFMSKLKSMFS